MFNQLRLLRPRDLANLCALALRPADLEAAAKAADEWMQRENEQQFGPRRRVVRDEWGPKFEDTTG